MSSYLLTGGAGTIGRALAKRIANSYPNAQIVIFDSSEYNLYQAQRILGDKHFTYQLGDVRNVNSLESPLQTADTVVHLAARKHVSFTNHAPEDTISTNIGGTLNIVRLALKSPKVKHLVNVSTDKACQPTTLYGATKLIGEHILVNESDHCKGKVLASVRFGNVLGSSGSVLEKWLHQAREGLPITVTDPRMRRFVMTEEQAVDLILFAAEKFAAHGKVSVKQVPVASLQQLLRSFIRSWQRYGHKTLEVSKIEPASGEKLNEDLVSKQELARSITKEGFILFSPKLELRRVRSGLSTGRVTRISQDTLDRLVSNCLSSILPFV